jgi:hypothetical protein
MKQTVVLLIVASAGFCFALPAWASIVNGDFELGNVGFTSDYKYFTPNPPPPPNEDLAQYTVWTNPREVHQSWVQMGDHTSGSGMMMIVNGSENPNMVVWSELVTLTAGVTYKFSAWGTGVYPAAPGNLNFELAGTQLGTLQLTSTVPDWKEFTATYTATVSGPAQLVAIRDLETAYSGNDFAMDDISLRAIPEAASIIIWSLLVGVGIVFGYWRKRKTV